MNKSIFWEELAKTNQRKRIYFLWKHGLDTTRTTYSQMSRDDLLDMAQRSGKPITNPDFWFALMARWEFSPSYKKLLFLLKEDKFAMDLLNVYDAVKDKALEDSDNQSIKNLILLQKEIKRYRESIDQIEILENEIEEDDGLII